MPFDVLGFAEIENEVEVPLPLRENDTVRVLRKALWHIQGGWCRYAYARMFFLPIRVDTKSLFATRYCAVGAIMKASHQLQIDPHDAYDALAVALHKRPGKAADAQIISVNDKSNKRTIVAAFKAAIANA